MSLRPDRQVHRLVRQPVANPLQLVTMSHIPDEVSVTARIPAVPLPDRRGHSSDSSDSTEDRKEHDLAGNLSCGGDNNRKEETEKTCPCKDERFETTG
jgi:hypothetical protein